MATRRCLLLQLPEVQVLKRWMEAAEELAADDGMSPSPGQDPGYGPDVLLPTALKAVAVSVTKARYLHRLEEGAVADSGDAKWEDLPESLEVFAANRTAEVLTDLQRRVAELERRIRMETSGATAEVRPVIYDALIALLRRLRRSSY